MWKLFGRPTAKKRRIYLDYASATPILPEAARAVTDAQRFFGNPGSIHADGVDAAQLLKDSREKIAHELGCKAREIVFVSGGTEGNNLAILGVARAIALGKVARNSLSSDLKGSQALSFVSAFGISPLSHTHWIVSSIEHPSVLECFGEIERLGGKVDFVDPDVGGIIRPETVARLLRLETVFISVGWANSEIGVVQPHARIAHALRTYEKEHGTHIVFHSDAGQAPLYLASNVHSLDVDVLTLDSGKLYGPRGIGAVYLNDRVALAPILLGGSQERGLRAGSENVTLAAGFAQAYGVIAKERGNESKRLAELRDDLAREIVAHIPDIIMNGDLAHSLPHLLNISIPNIKSEYVTLALDHADISISTKSACREGEARGSHVVKMLEMAQRALPSEALAKEGRAQNTLRFSLGRGTTAGDLTYVIETLRRIMTEQGAKN